MNLLTPVNSSPGRALEVKGKGLLIFSTSSRSSYRRRHGIVRKGGLPDNLYVFRIVKPAFGHAFTTSEATGPRRNRQRQHRIGGRGNRVDLIVFFRYYAEDPGKRARVPGCGMEVGDVWATRATTRSDISLIRCP